MIEILAAQCKGGVFLTINGNLSVYEGRRDYLVKAEDEWDEAELARLLEAADLYELQFYPKTPVGFYSVYGDSLTDVIRQALAILASPGG